MTACGNVKRYVGDGNGCCASGAAVAYGPCILKAAGAITSDCLPYSLGNYASGYEGRIKRAYKI